MITWLLAAGLAASGDGWSNLKHVTRDRLYVVVLRGGDCQYGSLSSVGEQALVLGTSPGIGRVIQRSQIERVSDNLTAPSQALVFSARSSWLDVKSAAPKRAEYLEVVTKTGKRWKARQPEVSEDAIRSEGIRVRKADIRYGFYVRFKPRNVDQEYLHQNDFRWMASIPVAGDLAPVRMSVLLYNSDLREDNAPIVCR